MVAATAKRNTYLTNFTSFFATMVEPP